MKTPTSKLLFLASLLLVYSQFPARAISPLDTAATATATTTTTLSQPTTATLPTSNPYPGITYSHVQIANPPLDYHLLQIDLTQYTLHVAPSDPQALQGGYQIPWVTKLATAQSIAQRENFLITINADLFIPKDALHLPGLSDPYFAGNLARPCGLAMTNSTLWSPRAPCAALVIDNQNHPSIQQLAAPPQNAKDIAAGSTLIIQNAIPIPPNPQDAPAPRTAIGLNPAATTLTILVVDGRRPDFSQGMTLSDLAKTLQKQGVTQALNLDGGGSTTLIMKLDQSFQTINLPSDGHQLFQNLSIPRPIAEVIGITSK